MISIILYPLLLLPISFVMMWISAWIGWAILRKHFPLDEQARENSGIVLAATLTLLGLIIGFSFSMATGRYDQRKNYEAAEANAVGTEYVRADLLPPAEAARVRALLRSYLDQRILFYLTRDDAEVRRIDARTAELQTELWSAVRAPAVTQPTPVIALAVAGMNEVLNSQGYTQSAWWYRIPVAAWALMAIIAVSCNILVGYGARPVPTGGRLLFVLPLLISVAFMLIADIDTPRRGMIRVVPQNLTNLAQSLRSG